MGVQGLVACSTVLGTAWEWLSLWEQLLPPHGCSSHQGGITAIEKVGAGAESRVLQPDLVLCPFLLQFRNPKVSLRVRLCDLLGHLQRSGERDCQEFYRALYIHAQPLHSCLPSRHALRKCVSQPPGLGISLLSPSPETTL